MDAAANAEEASVAGGVVVPGKPRAPEVTDGEGDGDGAGDGSGDVTTTAKLETAAAIAVVTASVGTEEGESCWLVRASTASSNAA